MNFNVDVCIQRLDTCIKFCIENIPCLFTFYKVEKILTVEIGKLLSQNYQTLIYEVFKTHYKTIHDLFFVYIQVVYLFLKDVNDVHTPDVWSKVFAWLSFDKNDILNGFVVCENLIQALNTSHFLVTSYDNKQGNKTNHRIDSLQGSVFFNFPNNNYITRFLNTFATLPGDDYIKKITESEISIKAAKLDAVWNPVTQRFENPTSRGKSKRTPKVHTGPRGGKYIIKNGKKVYL